MFICKLDDCCDPPGPGPTPPCPGGCYDLTDISGIYFCNGTAIFGPSGERWITVSGDIDMSCNRIFDVSDLGFCKNIVIWAHDPSAALKGKAPWEWPHPLDPSVNPSIAIGNFTGFTAENNIAIGNHAGQYDQSNVSIALGYYAGNLNQHEFSIAIGHNAGKTSQNEYSIAMGHQAGLTDQFKNAIAIGTDAGEINQNEFSIAIGAKAGGKDQSNNAIAIGFEAGEISQNEYSIAIGHNAGKTSQNEYSIAMGHQAGLTDQSKNSIAMGYQAGNTAQSHDAIAIGTNAGDISQNKYGIAIGTAAGHRNQLLSSIAIGYQAGMTDQSGHSIAIGTVAGNSGQQNHSIAIGAEAGETDQSHNAIAIGYQAGKTNQHPKTIIINAQDSSLNSEISGACYVAPIRNDNYKYLLYYNDISKEIMYDLWNVDCGDISNVDGIYFCNGTAILGLSGNTYLTISGTLDMSCNEIIEVSNIKFCNGTAILGPSDNTYLTISGTLDMSCNEIIEVSNIKFCNGTAILAPSGGNLTISGDLDMSCNEIIEISNLLFCNGTAILAPSEGHLTISGDLDMSCNDITDICGLYFCNFTRLQGSNKTPTTTYPLYIPGTAAIECSGNLDMSCNNIVDVQYLTFCRGGDIVGWIGAGGSIDISSIDDINLNANAVDSSINFTVGTTQEMRIDASHVSISGGSEGNPALNFGLIGNPDTGIYRERANAMGFSAAGNIKAGVSDKANFSILHGSVRTPGINFGIATPPDTNTGMYGIASDSIGFSTGGEHKVGIYLASDISYTEGLNVGLPDPSFLLNIGIRRLSAIPSNSWEDGHLGNSQFIYFTAMDFLPESMTTGRWRYQTNGIMGPASGVVTSNVVSLNLMASKLIPKGFKIKLDGAAQIYCDINSGGSPWGSISAVGGPPSMTIHIYSQKLPPVGGVFTTLLANPAPTISPSSFNPVPGSVDIPITTPSAVSDGTDLCVFFTRNTPGGILPPGMNAVPWYIGAGMVGARVPIERG
jgi:hypothetical protein